MASISIFAPLSDSNQPQATNELKVDFMAWLNSLQSGNDMETREAFIAVKKDFLDSPQAPPNEHKNA